MRRQLENKGADLAVFDSWVSGENTVDSLDAALDGAKAIVIVTEHDDIVNDLRNKDLSAMGIEVIVDGRNCLKGDSFVQQGILYRGIGRRA